MGAWDGFHFGLTCAAHGATPPKSRRGDWLKADPEKARAMGRKGGRAKRKTNILSTDYRRGYGSGWKACERFYTKALRGERTDA